MLELLNPDRVPPAIGALDARMRSQVKGQDPIVRALITMLTPNMTALRDPKKPIGSILLCGPTGTGKTLIAETLCQLLFPNVTEPLIKIDCAEFQHEHEIAKLIGAPPGYLGHNQTEPLLTQKRLNRTTSNNMKYPVNIVLFDEFDKAHPTLERLLLGILDHGSITLGNNKVTRFNNSIILLTVNVGAREMMQVLAPKIGFAPSTNAPSSNKITDDLALRITNSALLAVQKKYSPEFLNRLNYTLVTLPLSDTDLWHILEKEINLRLLPIKNKKIEVGVSTEAKNFLWNKASGSFHLTGAREIKRVIETYLIMPLANILSSGQVKSRSTIIVDHHPHSPQSLVFGLRPYTILGQQHTVDTIATNLRGNVIPFPKTA